MSDQADVIQAELDELRTQTARPASSDGDDIELLWNEVTTLQTTVKDAAQQAAEAATQKEDFATHKAAAEQHWQVSSAALAAIEDRISAVSVPSQLTPAPEAASKESVSELSDQIAAQSQAQTDAFAKLKADIAQVSNAKLTTLSVRLSTCSFVC